MARARKNKGVAGLLALFGGTIGLHRWYLGDVSGGIFYLFLFFIVGKIGLVITPLLGILEAIRFLSMSTREFDEKHNSGVPANRNNNLRRRQARQQGRYDFPQQQQQQRHSRQQRQQEYKQQAQPIFKSNPFKSSGIKKYKNFELDEAEKDLLESLKINNQDRDVHFTLAKLYSLKEEKDKSYQHIQNAIQLGFKDFNKIMTEDDFAYIRIQDDFETFKANGYTITRSTRLKKTAPQEPNLLDDDVLLSQLNKLAELRKKGLLSESEFAHERKKLLRK